MRSWKPAFRPRTSTPCCSARKIFSSSVIPSPESFAERAKAHWAHGVPMHWMLDWGTPFPIHVAGAKGSRLEDVDGHSYDDFCFGDTGSMFGHSPEPVARAIAEQAARGLTYMLPTEDVAVVGELLAKMFGLPFWQAATTATDANRFVIRWCRAITGRPKILVFHGCYHGAADDTFVRLKDGKAIHRPGLLGGLRRDAIHQGRGVQRRRRAGAALAPGDVACVLTEPALTNIGMVLPQPGFLEALRTVTRKHGTLLVIDETHTISTGYAAIHVQSGAGYPDGRRADRWDIPVLGIRLHRRGRSAQRKAEAENPSGLFRHGRLSAPMQMALHAMRANLEQVVTPAAHASTCCRCRNARRAASRRGSWRAIYRRHVSNVGARAEFVCRRSGRATASRRRAMHHRVELAIHLHLLGRGFHHRAIPQHDAGEPEDTADQIDRLVATIDGCLAELAA